MLTERKRDPDSTWLPEVSNRALKQAFPHLQRGVSQLLGETRQVPRRDVLHPLSTGIIRENQTVVIEELSVGTLLRNHSLARAISDAAWSEWRRQVAYKAGWYGRTVIAVDRFYAAGKTRSACGAVVEKLPLNVRDRVCRCGATHDRDVKRRRRFWPPGWRCPSVEMV